MASSSADGIAGGVDAMGRCNELFAATMESKISSWDQNNNDDIEINNGQGSIVDNHLTNAQASAIIEKSNMVAWSEGQTLEEHGR